MSEIQYLYAETEFPSWELRYDDIATLEELRASVNLSIDAAIVLREKKKHDEPCIWKRKKDRWEDVTWETKHGVEHMAPDDHCQWCGHPVEVEIA